MMDPACEINKKGTREKNDGNEVVEESTDTPLDLDPNEQIEADDETLPYAEEDWQDFRTDRDSQEHGTRSSVHDADSSERRDETKKEIQSLRWTTL